MAGTKPGNPEKLSTLGVIGQQMLAVTAKVPWMPSRHSYHLTVSHSHRFLWFRVAKVGTRTIFAHLHRAGVELDVEHAYNVRYSPARYEDYFKFAFVRDPWDRLASCWRDKVVGDRPERLGMNRADAADMFDYGAFVEWVAGHDLAACNAHFRLQSSLIDLNEVDFVGRHDSFSRDLQTVLGEIGVPTDDVQHENRSSMSSDHHDVYTPALVQRVGELYERDVKIFGYQPWSVE